MVTGSLCLETPDAQFRHKACNDQVGERTPEGRQLQSLKVTQALERNRAKLLAEEPMTIRDDYQRRLTDTKITIERQPLTLPQRPLNFPRTHSDNDTPRDKGEVDVVDCGEPAGFHECQSDLASLAQEQSS